jgi:hypothetical protein
LDVFTEESLYIMDMKVYKGIACSILVSSFLISAVGAKDVTKLEEKASTLEQKSEAAAAKERKEAAEGHAFRAGRAGKKAAKEEAKADKELKKAGVTPPAQ